MFAKLLAALIALFAKKPVSLKNEPVITNDVTANKSPIRVNDSNPSGRVPKAIGGVATASVLAAIVAFVAPWEGVRTKAYLDIAGVPTICYGHTKGVRMGDTATLEQCDAWLAEEVEEFNRAIRKCITREMTVGQEIGFTDISYNIGIGAFCGSTALKRFNAGDDEGGCEALKMWDKVRVNGQLQRNDWQVRRRAAESALCKKD